MSRYLITGATGFIGGHLAEFLISRGDHVRCLVRKNSETTLLETLDTELVEGELDDRDRLVQVVEDADFVVHLAGLTSAFSLPELMRVNRDGTFYLAQACAQQKHPPVLLLISSISASGAVARGQVRMEFDDARPVSNYGHSKRAGECAALLFANQIPISIVRPGMVFGERNTEMFPIFRSMALMGSHAVIGTASPRVSLIHVADLCEIVVRVAEQGKRVTPDDKLRTPSGDGVYFGVCDEAPTYARLGAMLKRILDKRGARQATIPSPISWLAGMLAELVSRTRGTPMSFNLDKIREAQAECWECSVENVINDLNYEFPIRLSERLKQTLDWYRQKNWL